MPEGKTDRRVDLEDLTASAMAGVSRALAARGIRPNSPFKFPIWVGFIANPDWGDFPWPNPTEPRDDPVIPLTMRDHTLIMGHNSGDTILIRLVLATSSRPPSRPFDGLRVSETPAHGQLGHRPQWPGHAARPSTGSG